MESTEKTGGPAMTETPGSAKQNLRIVLVILTVVLAAASCIGAPEFSYQGGLLWLQHLGTFVLLLPLLIDLKLRKFSAPVCILLFLFGCLHILGARYLYSNVPYEEWAKQLFNWHIVKPKIHGNHYDRLVHFAFGLLMLPFFVEVARHWLKIDNFLHALLIGWLSVQCSGMLYEIFEWLLTVVKDSEFVEGFNGQQGDVWDAQKDMFLALIGSTITAALLALHHRLTREPAATKEI